MRKLFAAAGIIFALAFPAMSFGADTTVTLYVTGSDPVIPNPVITQKYQPETYDDDWNEIPAVKGVVTFPAVSGRNYTFDTVINALEFAKNPQVYIQNNFQYVSKMEDDDGYSFEDPNYYSIEYDSSLQATMTTVTAAIETDSTEYPVNLSPYSAVTNITFTTTQSPLECTDSVRHFIADGTSNVTFSNIRFSGSGSGGGVEVSNGTVTFTGCTFTNCYTSGNGAGVSVSGGTVTFTGASFSGCKADGSGGGLYVSGTGSVTVSGTSSFTSCRANGSGGGLYSEGSGSLAISGTSSFTSCSADYYGGGMALSGGTVTLSGLSFTDCSVLRYGGGMSISGGSATISSSSFNSCAADSNGGAVSLTGGSLVLSGTSFLGGHATNGGAIYSSAGLTVGDGVIFNSLSANSPNTAEKGGAIYIASGTANISGADSGFTENKAENGGAIYIASGTVNISGSDITFTDNTVSKDGGAIYASSGSRVNLTGNNVSMISNVASEGSGGAIFASGDRTAITISSAVSEFASNMASSGDGGAILAGGGTVLTISGAASFTNNTANNGGAVYLSATRRGQTALNITGETEANFTGNIADSSGGAIYAETNSRITFAPSVIFTDNSANDGNGGAMWLAASSQLPEGRVSFDKNKAEKSDSTSTSTGSGGAIYIGGSSSSAVTVGGTRNYTFTGNSAASYGGALCTYSSDILFESYTLTVKNQAALGGGFAASYNAKISMNSSSFSNQATDGSGGVIWAKRIEAVSCDFGSAGANVSTGTQNHEGGGALYASSNGELILTSSSFTENTASNLGGAAYSYIGDLVVTDSIFTGNTAIQGGGALCAEISQVSITNSYFATNSTSSGNGGAVNLQGNCTSSITSTTLRNNTSSKLDGGAIYAQGTIDVQLCYLRENKSQRSGGAIYFNQNSDDPTEYSSFRMTSTMLEQNSTSGVEGNGGGLYVVANNAVIDKCTFSGNRLILGGNAGEGGGAYIYAMPIQDEDIEITNCTFYDNHIDSGASGTSGGGGLSVHCEKTTRVTSCTFVMNGSQYKGGAIYLGDGSKLQLLATIAVGNTDEGTYDIWSDGTILSGGYNRIGVYGKGTGVTDFYSETRNDSDRTSYPSKGWAKSTFFGNNALAVNEPPSTRTDLPAGNYPPYIGTTLSSRTRLLTLALSEDANLPLVDRATNIIPYSRRGIIPTTDERGVTRVPSGSQIDLDVGAVFFDGTRIISGDESSESPYTILRVEISGIPNSITAYGQSAGLIAKVYYTNGRMVLGGSGEGEEPVTWSSSRPDILSVSENGYARMLRQVSSATDIIITVTTVRAAGSGVQASDTKTIRINGQYAQDVYTYLNVSPELLQRILPSFEELRAYNTALRLADSNPSAVSASSFQASFSSVWANVTASQVTDIADDSLSFSAVKSYTASDGYQLAPGKAGVSINLSGLKEGDVFPLVYSWTFSGEELQSILGYDMSGKTITPSAADEIFSAMRIDFKGADSSWPVIGSGGVKASEAMTAGALAIGSADSGKGFTAELTAYLANVTASGSGVSSSANDGPQIIDGLLVVPDGNGNDSRIYGSVFMAGKTGSSQEVSTKTGTNSQTGTQTGTSASSGGGGCESFGAVLSSLAIILMASQKRKRQ